MTSALPYWPGRLGRGLWRSRLVVGRVYKNTDTGTVVRVYHYDPHGINIEEPCGKSWTLYPRGFGYRCWRPVKNGHAVFRRLQIEHEEKMTALAVAARVEGGS